MLYDPNWEKQSQTKADPFALSTLIAWLEKQPADKTYCYFSHGRCLLSQYFIAQGFEQVHMFGRSFVHGREVPKDMGEPDCAAAGWTTTLPPHFDDIANDNDLTFGGALRRARRAVMFGRVY